MKAPHRSFRIERFEPRQIRRILAIEQVAFPSETYTREIFQDLYRDCGGFFFVVKYSRVIAGYMVTCVNEDRAEIISLAVHPSYRRRGGAKALMAHTLTALARRRVRQVHLMVRTENHQAIAFYESFGFVRQRRVANYYEDGGEGLRMRKLLRAE